MFTRRLQYHEYILGISAALVAMFSGFSVDMAIRSTRSVGVIFNILYTVTWITCTVQLRRIHVLSRSGAEGEPVEVGLHKVGQQPAESRSSRHSLHWHSLLFCDS